MRGGRESGGRPRAPALRAAVAGLWLGAAPACLAAAPDASVEKADALVGTSVAIKNVYCSEDGVTITKLPSEREAADAGKTLQSVLNKYPASFISRVLKTVYIGSQVKFAETGRQRSWGGLYRSRDLTIFLKYDGNARALEQTFHHELAHGIHCAYPQSFNEKAWLEANPPEFLYTEKVDGRPPWPELLADGFVRPYAMFSLKEDVACLAEELVGNTEVFAKVAAKNPRLRRKAAVLVALYRAVDPIMTERYFRLQNAADDGDDGAPAAEEERGRPVVVSAQAARGVFVGNFKAGDRVTLLYRDKPRPAARGEITFGPRSPGNIVLCRRKKAREEEDLTPLAKLPRLTRETPFTYTFREPCAAVLKVEGEPEEGAERVRFEAQIDRGGE